MKKATSKKPKKFTLFDFLPAIIKDKKEWESFSEDQQKVFNGFMINKLLSMNPDYIQIVDYVAGLNIQDNGKLYKVYSSLIPQNWKTYFPFIKKKKTKKYDPELIKLMCGYFQNSPDQIEDYLNLMKKQEIVDILSSLGIEEKQIKKITKWQ